MKLTDRQVVKIRESKSFMTAKALADKYGISTTHVWNLVNGKFRKEAIHYSGRTLKSGTRKRRTHRV